MQNIHTNQGVETLREAQAFLMGGSGATLKATLKTTSLPPSMAYLHSLVDRGLADSYNYHDNVFVVKIQVADSWRFPALKDVSCIALKYRGCL